MHALTTLTQLVQEISVAQDAMSAKQLIVERLSELMEVPVCSLYLKSPTRSRLILAATHGLAQSSVGKIKLNLNEGLVGTIGATKSLINLADATRHENFILFPEADEAPYHQFMGVPLIHLRNLVGVLVIQGKKKQTFPQEAEAFLVTIASQLAATLYGVQRSGEWIPKRRIRKNYQRFTGVSGSSGIGIGTLTPLHHQIDLHTPPEPEGQGVENEHTRFMEAIAQVSADFDRSAGRASAQALPEELLSLFGIYRTLLESAELNQPVINLIDTGKSASWAVRKVALELAGNFEKSDDPYMQARCEDVKNIAIKLLNQMSKGKDPSTPDTGANLILAGDLISITDLSDYPKGQIQGIVSTKGSALSHSSIVASALGIPAVMGISDLEIERFIGQPAVVDGNRGELILSPPKEMQKEYRQIKKSERKFNRTLSELKNLPAVTEDGFHVTLLTNTGLLSDVTPGLNHGAEGIGLYRSEIPFMIHDTFPTEEEQYRIYKEVIDAYSPRPVTMRTLDIGGDKQLPYFEFKEENPYLGWRGVRFTLDNTSLQITQLRAMIRAAHGRDNLHILIPMISRIDEIKAIRELINQTLTELNKEGRQICPPKLGIMIEVPSIMLLLEKAAPYIDFVSIGSNDLTQYLTAVDRNNPKVSPLFDNLHPGMLLALHMIRNQCATLNLPVSLCGEMASDPASVLLLVAMGYDRLSLSAYRIPKIKWLIRQLNHHELQKLLEKALTLEDEQAIRKLLNKKLKTLGLGNQ